MGGAKDVPHRPRSQLVEVLDCLDGTL
jgi:hypothetical protein